MSLDGPWVSLAWRLAACASVTGLLWWFIGPAIALPSLVLWGIAVARPLFDAVTDLVRHLRAAAYRDVEGRYYMHAGHSIEIVETEQARWLQAAAVQRLLGDTSREELFIQRFGPGASLDGRRGRRYVRDDALLDYLENSPQAMDARRNGLRLFVQREVIGPHRRRQRNIG